MMYEHSPDDPANDLYAALVYERDRANEYQEVALQQAEQLAGVSRDLISLHRYSQVLQSSIESAMDYIAGITRHGDEPPEVPPPAGR